MWKCLRIVYFLDKEIMYCKTKGLWIVFSNSSDMKITKLPYFTLGKGWEIW